MPVILRDNRRLVALFAVVAMVASVLVIGAAPAQAAAAVPTSPATYVACPDGAASAAGFSDVSSTSFANADIDCIKYFGITQGTSATTYSPSANVTREQMALFLTRAAGPAGITLGDGSDQGFTDIAGLSAESQKAINQLAQLGVTKGTSATTYSPSDPVTREQMALFIARFLDKATVGPGGSQPKNVAATTPNFTDIGGTSFEAYAAIVDLFNLGVTTGTTATTYSPSAKVTREQMASFIARALNHTNARPAGVWIQSNKTSGFGALAPMLSVTHRNASFQPVLNTLVDVFEFTAGTGLAPFNTNGTCKNVAASAGNPTACKIELTDLATNANGNIAITESVANGASMTFYAWTDAVGKVYDNDIYAANNVTVVSSPAATGYKVTTNIATNAAAGDDAGDKLVKMGSTVTITVQLVDGTGKAVARSGQNVIFTDSVWSTTTDTGTASSINSTTVKTDASGTATFSVTKADPTTGNDTDFDETVAIGGVFAAAPVEIEWSDNARAAKTTKLAMTAPYVLASATASNTATATVYDQYGSGVSGATVTFRTDDPNAKVTGEADTLGTTVVRTTGAGGTASLTIARTATTSAVEQVTAQVTGTTDADKTVYWVVEALAAGSGGTQTVLVWDAAGDALVYKNGTVYEVAYYDSNDQFNAGGPVSFAAFDTAVGKEPLAGTYTLVTIAPYATTPSGVSTFTLS